MSGTSQGPGAAPYGTWNSPISSLMIAKMSVSTEDVLVDPVTSAVYYIEKRPEEGGRNVIVAHADGFDVFGGDWNARTAVQEYGGAPATVYDNIILFSNFDDGQVYKVDVVRRSAPIPMTSKDNCRFADFAIHPQNPNLVVCIMEDHTKPGPENVVNSLVCLNTLTLEEPTTLISGSDFYSSTSFSTDGTLLTWTEWAHPDMPWDGSAWTREQVFVAAVDINEARLQLAPNRLPRLRVAGKPSAISAVQPTWFNAHTLMFSCDISGYHNPWVSTVNMDAKTVCTVETQAVFADPLMLDFADPSWWLGGSNFAVLDDANALFAASKDGRTVLYVVCTDGNLWEIPSPFAHIVRMRRVAHRTVVFIGSKVDKGPALVLCSLTDPANPFTPIFTPLDKDDGSFDSPLSDSLISHPVPMSVLVPADKSSELSPLHLVYYPPKNPLYKGLPLERPPAIVNVHGGPTSLERQNLNLEKQFFTSRGWLWIDVNYSGSSNYGRGYIDRLRGNWGVSDVHDCVQAVLHLSSSDHSLIDRKRVVIRGGSAGGYTTLVALSQSDTNLQVFAAGASSYGISDLRKLTELTHKFQSWYAQTLVGGAYQDIPEVYRARSPVFHAHNIKVPLLILQGEEDPIVPLVQAQDMIRVIKEGGGTAECVVFGGEGHGWRKAETIRKALDLELNFYERALHLL
ncbi:alpha/beta-hydrolase [Mycena rosella]|uniref:Alpha/beta-hydrolase n=1 Tax=Mycena rosella TaxID=1033263 RepID=A0AAD7GHJ9_MYCRO|nr:alpha/beta-hydrolase [Mycena rosella]